MSRFNINKMNPFCRSLIEMEPRIKLYYMLGDIDPAVDDLAYCVDKNSISFACELPTYSHEIGHIVEMKDFSRLLLPNMGMKTHPNTDKGFFAAFARETRVRVIEYILHTKDPQPLNLINHPYWGSEISAFLPFGKFKNINQVRDWHEVIKSQTIKSWNLDRIRHEWCLRLDYLREYMDTKLVALYILILRIS